MKIESRSLINGKWKNSKKDLAVESLIDNSIIGYISTIDKDSINFAYECSYKTFKEENPIDNHFREVILWSMVNVLNSHKNYLSKIMAHEIGKKYSECQVEIERSICYIRDTIKFYKKKFIKTIAYNHKELNDKNKSALYKKVPIGNILCITPFNYPINLLIAKITPAIITGNYVIIKPATKGSLVIYEFIRLLKEKVNFKNIIQLLIGESKKLDDILLSHKNIAMINFTGSTPIANEIVKKSNTKNLILETGGKDAAIVMEDANLDNAINEIIKGAFNYNGQRCTAIKRVIVNENIYDKFIDELNKNVNLIKCGSPLDDNSIITPLISRSKIDFAKKLLIDAKNKGAKQKQDFIVEGNLLHPIILTNVKTDMKIWKYEQFCPILPIIKYKTNQDLIKIVNDSEYGLQCSIFTSNKNNYLNLIDYIDVATININKSSSRGPDILPFFGVKNSGYGIQGIEYSLESMVTLKGIVINKP